MSNTEGFQGCYVFKSRLQEYAQKVGLTIPVYDTIKEGPSHEPKFRSTVIVNDVRYDSLPGFFNRKASEHSAAEVALIELVKLEEGDRSITMPVEQKIKVSELTQYLGEVPRPICQEKIEKGNITTRINLVQYKHTLSYLRPEVREFINEHLPSLKFMLDLSCGGNQTYPGQIVNLVMHAKMNAGPREPEVWFHVNNMPVRFGKQEFCLVSGLSFNNTNGAREKEMNVSWAEKYFPEHKMGNNIKIVVVEAAIEKLSKLPELTRPELEDYVRLLMGCLIGRMMYVRTNNELMSMAPLGLLSDLSWADKFGWGQYWWENLISDVGQDVWNRKMDPARRRKYNMTAFPHIFLAWICEAIPHLGDSLGKKRNGDDTRLPRIANWTWRNASTGLDGAADLWAGIKEVRPTLVPTAEEAQTTYWKSFVQYRSNNPDQPLHPEWTNLFSKNTVLLDDAYNNRMFVPRYNFDADEAREVATPAEKVPQKKRKSVESALGTQKKRKDTRVEKSGEERVEESGEQNREEESGNTSPLPTMRRETRAPTPPPSLPARPETRENLGSIVQPGTQAHPASIDRDGLGEFKQEMLNVMKSGFDCVNSKFEELRKSVHEEINELGRRVKKVENDLLRYRDDKNHEVGVANFRETAIIKEVNDRSEELRERIVDLEEFGKETNRMVGTMYEGLRKTVIDLPPLPVKMGNRNPIPASENRPGEAATEGRPTERETGNENESTDEEIDEWFGDNSVEPVEQIGEEYVEIAGGEPVEWIPFFEAPEHTLLEECWTPESLYDYDKLECISNIHAKDELLPVLDNDGKIRYWRRKRAKIVWESTKYAVILSQRGVCVTKLLPSVTVGTDFRVQMTPTKEQEMAFKEWYTDREQDYPAIYCGNRIRGREFFEYIMRKDCNLGWEHMDEITYVMRRKYSKLQRESRTDTVITDHAWYTAFMNGALSYEQLKANLKPYFDGNKPFRGTEMAKAKRWFMPWLSKVSAGGGPRHWMLLYIEVEDMVVQIYDPRIRSGKRSWDVDRLCTEFPKLLKDYGGCRAPTRLLMKPLKKRHYFNGGKPRGYTCDMRMSTGFYILKMIECLIISNPIRGWIHGEHTSDLFVRKSAFCVLIWMTAFHFPVVDGRGNRKDETR